MLITVIIVAAARHPPELRHEELASSCDPLIQFRSWRRPLCTAVYNGSISVLLLAQLPWARFLGLNQIPKQLTPYELEQVSCL